MRLSRQEIRLAARSFTRHPGFAITAVLSLGLAIALNTTMYSVLDAMIKPKLDMRNPDQLYTLIFWGDYKFKVGARERTALIRSGFHTYSAASYDGGTWGRTAVEYGTHYAQASPARVAPDLFTMYGTKVKRGRLFTDADAAGEASPVILSDRLAESLSPDADFPVGASILVDGTRHPVIGILSPHAVLPSARATDLYILTTTPAEALTPNVIRLRDGFTVQDAAAEFELLSTRLAFMAGENPKYTRIELKQANKSQFSPQRFHYALIAAVLAVLLVACANLANLQLARGIGRSRELALRAALGASRKDIIMQLFVESALLAAVGLVAGVLLTFWGTHLLEARIPPSVADFVVEPQISWRVFAVAVTAGILSVLLVGLVPAIRVSRVDPNELLKSGAGTGANKKNRRQYGVMVAAEIGLSLALLSGAALVVRKAVQVRSFQLGYDPKPIAIASTFLRPTGGDTTLRLVDYANDALSRIRTAPGVVEASLMTERGIPRHVITVDERGGSPRELDAGMTGYKVVSASYFRVMGLPLLKGRGFLDGVPSESEVVIDEHTARSVFPGVDPIGLQMKLGEYKSDAPWARVVGVVAGTNSYRQLIMYGRSEHYWRFGDIYMQPSIRDSIVLRAKSGAWVHFLVRSGDAERTAVTLRRYLPQGGLLRLSSALTMEENLGYRADRLRYNFVASVFVTFAVLAIGLSALGIYGIVNHSVAERKRELGVRIALGATSRDILHAVLREGNAVALAGVAVGLFFTKNTAGWLHAFIFEDDQYNAPVFAAMAVILFAVAVLSALWPALRATRIDPVESLRSE